jgi:tetratricopeptide (TPR) repeat protein
MTGFLTAVLLGAHISFMRVIPAPHDLAPVQRIAVIYAIGDNLKVTTFVEDFVEYVGRSGTLRIDNAVEDNRHLASLDGKAFKRLRREHPADAYIGVSLFTCAGTTRSAEGSERDVDGARIRRLHTWLDATCVAKLDVRGENGRTIVSFTAHGEGTSPRSSSLSEEERDVAFEQATRYAALNAAEMITPRMVRETIELDDSAPSFDEGLAMINAGRPEDARAIWEVALRQHRDSAPLYFDLGAVCEATGDLAAARKYLQSAVRLSPAQRRYRAELDLLQRRNVKR